MLIGLTGIIGSGKSSVAKILHDDFDAVIIDADNLAHEALNAAKSQLRDNFGDEIFYDNGELNRSTIAKIVFNDDAALNTLQNITHPIIKQLFRQKYAEITAQIVVYDAPLLFEAGYTKADFDYIIVVAAPLELCIKRASLRSAVSEDEIRKRLKNQWPLERKIALADSVITNNGDFDGLRQQVNEVISQLRNH